MKTRAVVRVTLFVIVVSVAVVLSVRMVMPTIVIVLVRAVTSAESSWTKLRIVGTPPTVASRLGKELLKVFVRAVMVVMTVTATMMAMVTTVVTAMVVVFLVWHFEVVPISICVAGLDGGDDNCKCEGRLEHLCVYKIKLIAILNRSLPFKCFQPTF